MNNWKWKSIDDDANLNTSCSYNNNRLLLNIPSGYMYLVSYENQKCSSSSSSLEINNKK